MKKIYLNDFIQVTTTVDTKEDAETIAKSVVNRRLAACVQIIGPIKSTYWWNDTIETQEEWLLLMKTSKKLFDQLEHELRYMHPYETPEIIATPISQGNPDYLLWVRSELRPTHP